MKIRKRKQITDFIDRCLFKKVNPMTKEEEEGLRQYYELFLRMQLELINRPKND